MCVRMYKYVGYETEGKTHWYHELSRRVCMFNLGPFPNKLDFSEGHFSEYCGL